MNAVTRFLRAAYGSELQPAVRAPARPSIRWPWRRIHADGWWSPTGVAVMVAGLALVVLVATTIYYYNLLVRAYYDTRAARAKVEALLQRRNDLTLSLEKTVLASRAHETSVFTDVTGRRVDLRASGAAAPGPEAPPPRAWPLDRLLAIAEAYPQVRVTENLQSVIGALVDVERDLAAARQRLVDATNTYDHDVDTFPGNVYARLFGFTIVPYFEAAPEAHDLAPVHY